MITSSKRRRLLTTPLPILTLAEPMSFRNLDVLLDLDQLLFPWWVPHSICNKFPSLFSQRLLKTSDDTVLNQRILIEWQSNRQQDGATFLSDLQALAKWFSLSLIQEDKENRGSITLPLNDNVCLILNETRQGPFGNGDKVRVKVKIARCGLRAHFEKLHGAKTVSRLLGERIETEAAE